MDILQETKSLAQNSTLQKQSLCVSQLPCEVQKGTILHWESTSKGLTLDIDCRKKILQKQPTHHLVSRNKSSFSWWGRIKLDTSKRWPTVLLYWIYSSWKIEKPPSFITQFMPLSAENAKLYSFVNIFMTKQYLENISSRVDDENSKHNIPWNIL